MSVTQAQFTTTTPVLYVSFELGWSEWKLAFSTGLAQAPRLRTVGARKLPVLLEEIAKAKKRFGLPAETAVISCYEAGRDGFWLHRYLAAQGIDNAVIDSASIETSRRGRRAKTDPIDAVALLNKLIRRHLGDDKGWKIVRVPQPTEEDARHVHRDLCEMKAGRTERINRIKGLLASQGLEIVVDAKLPERLQNLRTWDGAPVSPQLQRRLLREFTVWKLIDAQIRDLDVERVQRVRSEASPALDAVRKLLGLRGVGINSAWLYVMELFWRGIRNRRELAALTGLTPTPYNSGDNEHEQGISKAGNRRVRAMAVELAWGWLHHQRDSELTQWYYRRFAKGSSRTRRIGIVALARKLLVALWRYLEHGVVPAGATEACWQAKMSKCRVRPAAATV